MFKDRWDKHLLYQCSHMAVFPLMSSKFWERTTILLIYRKAMKRADLSLDCSTAFVTKRKYVEVNSNNFLRVKWHCRYHWIGTFYAVCYRHRTETAIESARP